MPHNRLRATSRVNDSLVLSPEDGPAIEVLRKAVALLDDLDPLAVESGDAGTVAQVYKLLYHAHDMVPRVKCWVVRRHYDRPGWRPYNASGHKTRRLAEAWLAYWRERDDRYTVELGEVGIVDYYAGKRPPENATWQGASI